MGNVHGTYELQGGGEYRFRVTNRDFSGFIGDDVEEFVMVVSGDALIYSSDSSDSGIGVTGKGSVFFKSAQPIGRADENSGGLEPIILRDESTGNTEDLYPIPDEEELLFYGNEHIGYNVSIPFKIFTEVVLLPDNGDGMILASKDEKARFRVSGGFLIGEAGEALFDSYSETLGTIGGVENASFHDAGEDYWEIHWRQEETIHKRKFLTGDGAWADCEIYYEWEEGVVNDPLPDVTDRAMRSLGFAEG
jgi:hypothetical protein